LAEIEQAEIPVAFDELARRFAAMRDTLQEQRNDDPEIATLKKQANAALAVLNLDATEGLLGSIRTRRRALSANATLAVLNLDATEGLLMSIRTRQRALPERRRRVAEKARADLIAALKDEAETCLQQADTALLRFDVTMALSFSRDGIAVLAETLPATRWRYMFQVIDSLSKFGDRAGSNEALLASIELSGPALLAVERERVPLAWAMTQTNLGTALLRLGERERGTARLEEAVADYRAALEERTRERVPLDWAMTQNNLGIALWALGARESWTARLEEAISCWDACLQVATSAWLPERVEAVRCNRNDALAEIAQRSAK